MFFFLHLHLHLHLRDLAVILYYAGVNKPLRLQLQKKLTCYSTIKTFWYHKKWLPWSFHQIKHVPVTFYLGTRLIRTPR